MSDCCSAPIRYDETQSQCRLCGHKGHKVERLTIEHMLTATALARLNDHPYHFCRTPTCSVVYFSNEADSYFHKEDVRIRIGLKETEDPIPICYCFGFTEKMIRDEIREAGRSTIPGMIRAEIKAGHCACEVKNPSGRCCLGSVMDVVREESHGQSVRARTTEPSAGATAGESSTISGRPAPNSDGGGDEDNVTSRDACRLPACSTG